MHDQMKEPMHTDRTGREVVYTWLASVLGGVLVLLLLTAPNNAGAEGSKELTQYGGARPHLEYIVSQVATPPGGVTAEFEIAGIQRQTIIYVYAKNGETINLASSVMSSDFVANGVTARIVAVPPNAASSPVTFLPGNSLPGSKGTMGCGHITARVNEVAGPDLTGNGTGPTNSYNSCQINVTSADEGVWEIHFVSPRANRTTQNNPNPAPVAADSDWSFLDPTLTPVATVVGQTIQNTYVAAWDVTVANGTTPIPGRVYLRSLSVTTGANGTNAGVKSKLYVKAYDGALYEVDLNDIDGFTSVFFADTRGAFTTADGKPIYRSLQLIDPTYTPTPTPTPPAAPTPSQTPPPSPIPFLRVFGEMPPGFGVKSPFSNDTPSANAITHKLFLNPPATDLPASAPVGKLVNGGPVVNAGLLGTFPAAAATAGPSLATPQVSTEWLANPYIAPQPPQNLAFVGSQGTLGQAGSGMGGFFLFTNTNPYTYATSYRVTLDFGPGYASRYLTGPLNSGSNSVFWDGRDGNNVIIPGGLSTFTITVTLNNGEIHFPVIDAELHTKGYKITRLTPATPTPVDIIYWDDRYFYTGNGPYDYSLCANGQTPVPSFPGGAGSLPTPLKCYGTNPNRNGLAGVASSGGAHTWFDNAGTNASGQNNGFGNKRLIDTWTLIPSLPISLTGSIIVVTSDLQLKKTASPASYPGANAPYTYTVVVTNQSSYTMTGAKLVDLVPPALDVTGWTCAITSVSCNPDSGTTNGITTLLNMAPGSVVTLTITGTTVNTATSEPCNTATVIRPPDVFDPDPSNNSSSVGQAADKIGLAMRVVETRKRVSPAHSYRVVMEYIVQNPTAYPMSTVQVTHSLETWFPGATIEIVSLTSPTPSFTPNGFFTGGNPTEQLLTTASTLPANSTGTIQLIFNVTFTSDPGTATYTSNSSASATVNSPTPFTTTDTSTNGALPNPNGDCDPTNDQEATPINFSTDATSISLLSFTGSSGWGTDAVWVRTAVIALIVLLLNVLLTLWLRRMPRQSSRG